MDVFHHNGFRAKTLHLLDDAMAMALLERVGDIKRHDFKNALWVGGGDASALKTIKTIETLYVRASAIEGAIEHVPFEPESLDLVIINGTLHTINDFPGVLVQIRRALKPDGLLLCALTGGETLHELRDALTKVEVAMFGGAAPRVHPMIDLPTMSALMQRAGFALPVVDTDLRIIFYKKLRTLLKDIKASGEGLALAQRSRKYMGRDFWDGVEAYYKAHHAEADGLLCASIEVLYAIGWAPADSQQKPLKPGQAKNRLADALGTIEGALPDKAKP